MDDATYMRLAIEEARQGAAEGNSPYGAVVVRDGQVIGRGHNRTTSAFDPSAHGEVEAVRDACKGLRSITLEGATLYTTGEPCIMCQTAMRAAGIARLVVGAFMVDSVDYWRRNPRPATLPYEQTNGVLRQECVRLYEP
ncbi:MAG: nucleoside deaminase [Dehalococcoidia bacterium]